MNLQDKLKEIQEAEYPTFDAPRRVYGNWKDFTVLAIELFATVFYGKVDESLYVHTKAWPCDKRITVTIEIEQ